MTEFIKTGVRGLDIILKGGLRKNSSLLITGAPGTGKTIMSMQFIYYGAKDYNENGIYIASEDNLPDLRKNAKNLGMDLEEMEKKGNNSNKYVRSKSHLSFSINFNVNSITASLSSIRSSIVGETG